MPCPGDVGTLGICSRELLHRRSQPEEGWGRERQASPSSTADHLQRVRSPCLSFLTCPVEIMLLQEARRRKAFGDRLPRGFIAGSWSRGTPGSLIIHLVLRQVLETAPVTHCAEKGRRVPDATSGAAGCFPCDRTRGEMPPPSLQLFGSLAGQDSARAAGSCRGTAPFPSCSTSPERPKSSATGGNTATVSTLTPRRTCSAFLRWVF